MANKVKWSLNKTVVLLWLFLICMEWQSAMGQKFWLTTYEFHGGPKTAITILDDSCIFTSTPYGVMRSLDLGNHFDSTLKSSPIYTVFTSASGSVFAGGTGKIFYTANKGANWDSVVINSSYPVTQLVENQQGYLFAITGVLTNDSGFVGSGVFFSGNGGATWVERNNGLGAMLSCQKIALDKNNRLYLTVADEYSSGNGGLFISEDNGVSWQHIPITIDGKNVVNDSIIVVKTSGLSVSPDDSVYFSFSGVAVNALVTLNICKSINDIKVNSFWNVFRIYASASWWLDRNLHDIYFAQNGDRYSSASGSINSGGTYFSTNNGSNWTRIDYGLGLNMFGARSAQYFAGTERGKVFMVQYLDERVYWADTSVVAFLPLAGNASPVITCFPNPCYRGCTLSIVLSPEFYGSVVHVFNIMGQEVISSLVSNGLNQEITLPAGVYFILAEKSSGKTIMSRFVVE